VIVSLTDKGLALHQRVRDLWAELNSITTAGLNGNDRAELERLLLHVLQNLTPETQPE
jgi:DNA-binding MarR family transcriptional regulator